MKSITYNLSMRKERMHDALKGTRKIHDDLDLFSFIKRELEEIVLEKRGFLSSMISRVLPVTELTMLKAKNGSFFN
jgi:hypothetical protein